MINDTFCRDHDKNDAKRKGWTRAAFSFQILNCRDYRLFHDKVVNFCRDCRDLQGKNWKKNLKKINLFFSRIYFKYKL